MSEIQKEADTTVSQDSEDVKAIRSIFGIKKAEKEVKPEAKPEVKPKDTEPKDEPKPEVKPDEKPEEKEPEFDEIVYNKEKVKIPVTERQTYLQKGYNYDKVKEKADKAQATLLKIAKLEGFDSIEDYEREIDNKAKAQLAEKIEEAAGDPDKLDDIIKNHPEVVKTKEERRKLEFERMKSELSKDRFFTELEPQFMALVEQNPTVNPDLLYKIVRNDYLTQDKIDELIAKEKESAQKKVLADMHDKERRTAPKGGDADGEENEVVQPSEFSRKLSNIFGISPSAVAQRANEKKKRS